MTKKDLDTAKYHKEGANTSIYYKNSLPTTPGPTTSCTSAPTRRQKEERNVAFVGGFEYRSKLSARQDDPKPEGLEFQ
eukprot:5759686-Amphidinium_carterae.1